MKRKIKLVAFLMMVAMLAGCGKEKTITTDKEEVEDVYEIAQIKKTVDDGSSIKTEITQYDEKGNEIYYVRGYDGEISEKRESVYDINGNIIKTVEKDWYGDIITTQYKYDKNNNMTKETQKINGKKSDYTTYKYDRNGNMIASTAHNKLGIPIYRIKRKYNKNGQITKEKVNGKVVHIWEYDSNGVITKEQEYDEFLEKNIISEYDSNGVKTECLYREDGSLKYQAVFDSDGNMKHYLRYASDGSIEMELVFENEYDSAGKKIKNTEYLIEGKNKIVLSELKYNENEILTEKIRYMYDQGYIISRVYLEEYDNQGNLLKEVSTDSDGSSDQQEYEYDSRGNQIKYTHINRDGSVYKEESEYDDKGNIIRWTRSTDGVTDKEEKYEYGYRE